MIQTALVRYIYKGPDYAKAGITGAPANTGGGGAGKKLLARRREQVNNRWVVPHNPWLLTKYDCHINVEVVVTVAMCKYFYKYKYAPGPGLRQPRSPSRRARAAWLVQSEARYARVLVRYLQTALLTTTSTFMWQSYLVSSHAL